MSATTEPQVDNLGTSDHEELRVWERPPTLDDWFDAAMEMQRSYLEWVQVTMRMFAPQIPVHN